MKASTAAPVRAFVGLGANLDDPGARVVRVQRELGELPQTRLVAASSCYRSPPLGPSDQPDYVNAVVELETTLAPHALLDELQRLERVHHRVRTERWGPRTLDLDLLLYGSATLADERLTVPHPGIAARAFVLLPLAEIAADFVVPGLDRVRDLLASVDCSGVSRL